MNKDSYIADTRVASSNFPTQFFPQENKIISNSKDSEIYSTHDDGFDWNEEIKAKWKSEHQKVVFCRREKHLQNLPLHLPGVNEPDRLSSCTSFFAIFL